MRWRSGGCEHCIVYKYLELPPPPEEEEEEEGGEEVEREARKMVICNSNGSTGA